MASELDVCSGQCNQQSTDEREYWDCIGVCEQQEAARQAARCTCVPTEVLERIGWALWGLMEDEGWTDDMLGLQPGDRLQIPGALTGPEIPV